MSNKNNGFIETDINELYDQLTDAERLYIIDCMKTMMNSKRSVSKQNKNIVSSDFVASL